MFQRIEIRGLGPHDHTVIDLDPSGSTPVTGPSEAGKSTLGDAIAFVLWGQDRTGKAFDDRAIRDGHEEVRVDATLASGTVLTRTLGRRTEKGARGPTYRGMTRHGAETQEYTTEKAWLGALKWMGRAPAVLLQVLVPMAWVPLAQGEGSGRPLRNLLCEALPTAGTKREIIAALMRQWGAEFREGDPINESDAGELRRKRGAERDQLRGKIRGHREGIERIEKAESIEAPSVAEVTAAHEVLRVEAEWAAGDNARARAEESAARVAEVEARATEWDAKLAELGERPADDVDVAAIEKRRAELVRKRHVAEKERDRLERELREADPTPRDVPHPAEHFSRDVNAARRRLADAKVLLEKVTDVCPHCERAGWDGAKAAATREHAAAEKAVAEADDAYQAEEIRLANAEADRQEKARAVTAEVGAKLTEVKAEVASLDQEIQTAIEASAAAKTSPGAQWDRERQILGRRPEVPAAIPAPPVPTKARPSAEQVAGARALLEQQERAAASAAQKGGDLDVLREQLREAEGREATLSAEYDRLDVLVRAVRAEPSESVRRQIGALGDLGPVKLVLLENGGVEVLVDGRPWHLASTGRQVVADTWLRAGIRRAAGVPRLPLLIDCAQDVGGQVLPEPAPCIVLHTTDDEGLAVAATLRKTA